VNFNIRLIHNYYKLVTSPRTMLSRVLFLCCFWFQFNGLLGQDVALGTLEILQLQDLNSSIPMEGIFVIGDDGVQRNYYEQEALCKTLYNYPGTAVTLLKNLESLKAASRLTGMDVGAGHRIGLTNLEGIWRKYTFYGTWTWEDGSTIAEDDDLWKSGQPQSTISSPVLRFRQCAAWKPNGDDAEFGHIETTNCYNAMYHAICQISDIDECLIGESTCGADLKCINTLGGHECAAISPLDVYTTMATYYKGIYTCGQEIPTEEPGCSPYSRLSLDSTVCYDSEYASCVDNYHADMSRALSNIYTAVRDCHEKPCHLGETECPSSSDERECFAKEFPELISAFGQCSIECNLLAACGGGGFDCVAKEEECKACFQALEQ